MAEARFLHISFAFKGKPKVKELEEVFNKGLDWMRYAPNCWIVWTTSTPKQWYDRLKPQLTGDDSCLIVTIDLSSEKRYGQMFKWEWEWMQKKR